MRSSTTEQELARNKLLAAMMSTPVSAALVAQAVAVPLAADQVIFDVGDHVDALCFPVEGVVSLSIAKGDRATEVAMVGSEGFLGTAAYLGRDRSILRATVLQPGTCFVLSAGTVREFAAVEPRAAEILNWYVAVQLKALAQAAFCRSAHRVEQQVARWLLMCLDRVRNRSFEITHGALARALGVRRASVTEVARRLQAQGIIEYHLGAVVIRDAAKLERAACECYRAIRDVELDQPAVFRTERRDSNPVEPERE